MPKIFTFTANLLAETTYEFSEWKEGRTQRAEAESFQVGGKGINVSKMLNRLEAANEAICFPGGDFGPRCEQWLRENGISYRGFREGCVTRSGSVIRSRGKRETTFLGLDSTVSISSVQSVVSYLDDQEGPVVLAICGSVQNWAQASWEPLRDWVDQRSEGVRLVVDNYGESLPWFAERMPDLIKINRDELETLFPAERRGDGTGGLLLRAMERYACPRWVVTDGGDAVWVAEKGGEPMSFNPPEVECVSPTGCGDVVFATLIDCLYNKTGYSLFEAAQLAAEYASRSAAMPGIAEFEL